jgi:hypothetical protein
METKKINVVFCEGCPCLNKCADEGESCNLEFKIEYQDKYYSKDCELGRIEDHNGLTFFEPQQKEIIINIEEKENKEPKEDNNLIHKAIDKKLKNEALAYSIFTQLEEPTRMNLEYMIKLQGWTEKHKLNQDELMKYYSPDHKDIEGF